MPQTASVVEEFYEDMYIALTDRIPDRRKVKTMDTSLVSSVIDVLITAVFRKWKALENVNLFQAVICTSRGCGYLID